VILVAGGSGFVGSAVVRRLVGAGEVVKVMSAHPGRSRARIERMGAGAVAGDVQDASSLGAAVRGAEVVVQILTFPTFPVQKPRKGYTFEEFEHRGTERLVMAATKAGVRKYLYQSGVNVGPDAPTPWFRAKWWGEEAVRASGIDHCIIRPSWAYGPEDRALNRFIFFHRWLPFVPVIGDGNQQLQPVFVEDVAEAHARASSLDGPTGTFEIGGPDVLSMNQILETVMEIRGKRKPLIHFPVFMPKLAGFFVQVLPRPPLSPEAVDFALADALADTGPLLEAFRLRLTPLREGLATYLQPRG
jgi:uncharacterized protein YbjT (DUF2867 family)